MNTTTKNQLKKTKKIKIDLLTVSKIKNDKKTSIKLNDTEKKKSNDDDNNDKKEIPKYEKSLNESTKIIKDNINLIEKEIISFKQHNLYIKEQLEKMFKKNKQNGELDIILLIQLLHLSKLVNINIFCVVFIKNVYKYYYI